MIKSLVLFACVLVATNALSETLKGQFMEKMMEIGKTCVKEVGANEDDIAELLAHKLPSRHEGECMVYCFHKHLGLMNDDGTLNKEGAKSAIEPLKNDDPQLYEKVVKIGKECAKEVVVDDDKCKYATKLTECGAKKGKEVII